MAETVLRSLAVTAAGQIDIPSGCYIREIIQEEKSGNKVLGGIGYGSSNGAFDIVNTANLEAGGNERVVITSFNKPTAVYFDAIESWNNASVDIYVIVGSLTD